MSILSSNYDLDVNNIFRINLHKLILDEVNFYLKSQNSILLCDPHAECDMHILQNNLVGSSKYYDLAQCKAGDYVDFVKDYVLPLVYGQIKYLLVDNIDKIPKIKDKAEFENILKYLARREDYNPFQNYSVAHKDIPNVGTIDFDKVKDYLIMRCENVPEILTTNTYRAVDCRSFVLMVHEHMKKTSKDCPLMLIFGKSNDRLDECKRWLNEEYNCVCIEGHPFKQGSEHFFDTNGNLQKFDDHPELQNKAILPIGATSETDFILIHRYLDQFNWDAALSYALDVVREHHIPVIYLANDYEYEKNRDIDLSGFHTHFIE